MRAAAAAAAVAAEITEAKVAAASEAHLRRPSTTAMALEGQTASKPQTNGGRRGEKKRKVFPSPPRQGLSGAHPHSKRHEFLGTRSRQL